MSWGFGGPHVHALGVPRKNGQFLELLNLADLYLDLCSSTSSLRSANINVHSITLDVWYIHIDA